MADAPPIDVRPVTWRLRAAIKAKSLLERLSAFIFREPENREELLEALHEAHERNLLDADAMSMIEGVLQVSELRARDLMIPRPQMDVVDISEPPSKWIPFVIETAHSRFPVIDGNRDHVIGILLAKDLLRYYTETDFDVRASLRPAVFIPESKPLNVLLRDFRANRNHIAIVVDEYGGVAGLITIEDVLEQIVGDIEDEYDFDESDDAIIAEEGGSYRVKGADRDRQFNETLWHALPRRGIRHDRRPGHSRHLGRVPKRGDAIEIGEMRFEVLRADARQAHLFLVQPRTEDRGARVLRGQRTAPSGTSDERLRVDASVTPHAEAIAIGRGCARRRRAARVCRSRRGTSRGCRCSRWRCSLLSAGARAACGQAAALGFAFGLGWFGVGVSWVYISMHVYGQMPAPLAALAHGRVLCVPVAVSGARAGGGADCWCLRRSRA